MKEGDGPASQWIESFSPAALFQIAPGARNAQVTLFDQAEGGAGNDVLDVLGAGKQKQRRPTISAPATEESGKPNRARCRRGRRFGVSSRSVSSALIRGKKE
jgi:hypothetical protein